MTVPALKHRPKSHQWQDWALLLLLSAIFTALLSAFYIPAALMMGPLFAGICLGCRGSSIRIPLPAFKGAQTFIGCMIAANVSPQVLHIFLHDWWFFLIIILAAVIISTITGLLLAKFQIVPGSTAIWGCSPGAASTMVIMAAEYGADIRMVSFLQYSRVLLTTLAAVIVAAFLAPEEFPLSMSATREWFPTILPLPFLSTLGLAIIGGTIAYRFKIPAGFILVPLFIGATLRSMGLLELQLPYWLMAISFAILGWRIGFYFDRESLRRAYHVMHYVIASSLILILCCGFLSYLLVLYYGTDPLTAFLATSPGGLDTAAVIGASQPYTDLSFIMTLQVTRLLLLNLICPPLAKKMTKYTEQKNTS